MSKVLMMKYVNQSMLRGGGWVITACLKVGVEYVDQYLLCNLMLATITA